MHACGPAHVGHGRGPSQIEGVNAAILPRGASVQKLPMVLSQVEQKNSINTPQPAQRFLVY